MSTDATPDLITRASFTLDHGFQTRIRLAAKSHCLLVAAEAQGPNYAVRWAFAKMILSTNFPDQYLSDLAVCDGTITPSSDDTDLLARVAAVFDVLALPFVAPS